MWNKSVSGGLNESIMSGNGFMTGELNTTTNKTRISTQNLLPCTIATIQLLDPSRDSIIIGDTEVHQITIIGLIKSVKQSPTNLTYEIDDMTGPPIDVKQWLESKDSDNMTNTNQEVFPENTYVRIFGSIRSFSGKKSILAFQIWPVLDMNELTTHILDIIYSHIKLTNQSHSNGLEQYSSSNTHKFNTNNINSSGKMEDSMANASFTQGYNSGLNALAQQILRVISSCTTEEGLTISHVKNSLSSVSLEQLRKEMEFLCNEGHIYCTIDDDHYKATDNFY